MKVPQSTQWARDNRERNRANNNALRARKKNHVNAAKRAYRAANGAAVQRERESNRIAAKGRYKELYARHRAIVDQLKSVPCADCGGMFDPICMDFDHRPDEVKLYQISNLIGRSTPTLLLAEIAKCDVVCSNCHRLRTRSRGTWSPESVRLRREKSRSRKLGPQPQTDSLDPLRIHETQFDLLAGVAK